MSFHSKLNLIPPPSILLCMPLNTQFQYSTVSVTTQPPTHFLITDMDVDLHSQPLTCATNIPGSANRPCLKHITMNPTGSSSLSAVPTLCT